MEHIKYILARKVVSKYVDSCYGINKHHIKKDKYPLEHPPHGESGKRGDQGVLFRRCKLSELRVQKGVSDKLPDRRNCTPQGTIRRSREYN
jgi:hypothetical protein